MGRLNLCLEFEPYAHVQYKKLQNSLFTIYDQYQMETMTMAMSQKNISALTLGFFFQSLAKCCV